MPCLSVPVTHGFFREALYLMQCSRHFPGKECTPSSPPSKFFEKFFLLEFRSCQRSLGACRTNGKSWRNCAHMGVVKIANMWGFLFVSHQLRFHRKCFWPRIIWSLCGSQRIFSWLLYFFLENGIREKKTNETKLFLLHSRQKTWSNVWHGSWRKPTSLSSPSIL